MSDKLGHILVVDDEELNRDMLSRRLQVEGYTCVLAANGQQALEQVALQEFDAVLLDVMMPGMNGYQCLAQIRQTQSAIELPVLMVTAKSQNDDVVNAFTEGANDYITKPINFPVALARLKCHVGSRRMSAQLRASELRFSLSAQGSNDGLWDWDLQTDRIYYSERWKEILGYQGEDLADSPQEWFSRIHPEDRPHVERALAEHQAGKAPQFESEYRMLHRDQNYRWVLVRGVAVRDTTGVGIRMAGSQTDITRGKAADSLTGLPNRVMLLEHLNTALNTARRTPGSHYALLFLDLDRFKIVNDSLGHQMGDQLLVSVAKRLEACMRNSDVILRTQERCTVSRFGGDEFVILCPGLAGANDASAIAERILLTLSEPLQLDGHQVIVSASIGIVVGHSGSDSAANLLQDADTAMYAAKAQGKARWCLYDQSLRDQARDRLALESELLQGIVQNQFHVHYQPIVDLKTQSVGGFEALLRWKHPTRGMISPQVFIPIAEETGFIVELGQWVLEQACRQCRAWQLEYPNHDRLFISVNVSPLQFANPKLIEQVQDCLERTGLPGECLKLEITESALMDDTTTAASRVLALRALGLSISLDDFGTGYSSLSYLQNFHIDTLKIDRSFINRLGNTAESKQIVKTIINLAHNLGMNVTAEGIEDDQQHYHLQEMRCENGQGYHYSKPLSMLDAQALLDAPTTPRTPTNGIHQPHEYSGWEAVPGAEVKSMCVTS
jgi:diguanylate cyclase (GGDEF)-like protein/PAS domain S-box-containing protein